MLLNLLENRQQKAAQGIRKLNLTGPPYPSISSLLDPENGVYSHPVSKLLTDIQRTFLDMTSLPEQVAMLYLVFLLLRWQTYSTPENYDYDRLPDWLTPRLCQLLTPHPAWMDYLPWPWMRERLVMSYFSVRGPVCTIYTLYRPTGRMKLRAVCCLSTIVTICSSIRYSKSICAISVIGLWGPVFAGVYPAMAGTTSIKTDMPRHVSFSEAFQKILPLSNFLGIIDQVAARTCTDHFAKECIKVYNFPFNIPSRM